MAPRPQRQARRGTAREGTTDSELRFRDFQLHTTICTPGFLTVTVPDVVLEKLGGGNPDTFVHKHFNLSASTIQYHSQQPLTKCAKTTNLYRRPASRDARCTGVPCSAELPRYF
eukprot:2788289-Rhodomonas_salina.1